MRLLRWGVLAAAGLFLYAHFNAGQGTALVAVLRELRGDRAAVAVLLLTTLLVPVNWGMESAKWRRLMRPVQPLGRWRAFVATLAGTGIALITPNRTGEFVGRVLFLEPGVRVAGSIATALGSIAQFVVTLVAGALALVLLGLRGAPFPWASGAATMALLALTLLVAAGALVFYFRPALLRQLLLLVPLLRRLRPATRVLGRFRRKELLMVLAWSTARYAVFTGQFVLLCGALHSGLAPGTAALAVAVVYLIGTLVPTMFISELGVRGSVAIAVMVPLGGGAAAVVAASGILWLLNVVLPAAVGTVLLLTARIRTKA